MAKAELELVKLVLQRNELDVRKVAEIMQELQNEIAAQVEEKPPPVKKQFVMMVSDPSEKLKSKDFTGWVLQIPEEDSPLESEQRLINAIYEYNTTPKGQRIPIKSIGEGCEVLTPKITKEHSVWVKTKEPVLVVCTNNEVPKLSE